MSKFTFNKIILNYNILVNINNIYYIIFKYFIFRYFTFELAY